jgi:hypothetical protein
MLLFIRHRRELVPIVSDYAKMLVDDIENLASRFQFLIIYL